LKQRRIWLLKPILAHVRGCHTRHDGRYYRDVPVSSR
jgi:hypothetical protein